MRGFFSTCSWKLNFGEYEIDFCLWPASYPHALHHLDLLQIPQFRAEIGKDEWREYLNQKQFDHWRTW